MVLGNEEETKVAMPLIIITFELDIYIIYYYGDFSQQ